MTAYKKEDLYNRLVAEDAAYAFRNKLITGDSYKKILLASKHHLYTPNYFIRIGLAILTFVAIIFVSLLLGLIASISSMTAFVVLCFFMSLLCYVALEFFVKQKYYYNAGIDNVLSASAIMFLYGSFLINDFSNQYHYAAFFSFLGCSWLAYRFIDRFMAVLAYVFLFTFLFLTYLQTGSFGNATIPFVMMIFSGLMHYFLSKFISGREIKFHETSINVLLVLTLLSLYTSGNYYVVKEFGSSMLGLPADTPLPLGWLFWIFTIGIPPLYVLYGIKKKNVWFMRTGIILIIVSVLTFRYYYAILPLEFAMLLGGIIFIIISTFLIKYLKTPKAGFISADDGSVNEEINHLEALVVAQAAGKKAAHAANVEFGGGSSGGAGASGTY